ncbi:MAG: cobaltochelatase subunit CobN [Actinobacteria bacterium]|nr:cobaltochelatase subunit CobN [Actinomycetota bacterium]
MTILVLTNADTEILALRTVIEGLPQGFPAVRAANPNAVATVELDGVEVVLVRLLGGRDAWREPFDDLRRRCLVTGIPLVAFGGEAAPDAELTDLSTVPSATVAQAFEYLVHGGLANVEHLLRFLSDTVLVTGFGFDPPVEVPATGVFGQRRVVPLRPTVGVVFYRAHLISGNTQFVTDLCEGIEASGANALAVWCYSLRPDADGRVPALDLLAERNVDAVVTTVLAMGSASGDDWDASALAALDVPVVQAIAATTSSGEWEASDAGLVPLDVAMAVAIPEFDGRIVSVPFSFKETVDDGDELGTPVTAYRTRSDRVARVAGVATRMARLRHVPAGERRVAIVLSAYPTKRSRLGNAVGLDTPASTIHLLHALREAGYLLDRIPDDGDSLMAELADGLGTATHRWPLAAYQKWFSTLPDALRDTVTQAWGEPSDDLPVGVLDLGGVIVAIQPPRGWGENPVAVYHSPDLPPLHEYLGFYRWLEEAWGADAIVHVGKHGTLEWLPGKGVGLSAGCGPDAALGDLPLIYPFVVNDPGEGTQAKRRAHAVVIDHLLPPMTRAETYDDVARLETLLDEHARIAALDPAKLPAVRRQVWDLLVDAELHRDLGILEAPEDDDFDDLVLHVDGYLCELKDAQIRGGLHVLGQVPDGEVLLDLVLALTRLPQGGVPSLRHGLAEDAPRAEVDAVEVRNREMMADVQARGWRYDGDHPTLRWVCERLVPALRRTPDELGNLLGALDGRYVPAGPSGAPTRGMAHVLPTGRNFYSVDPKAVPSPLAMEVGAKLAHALLGRHLAEEGRYPEVVGLVVWGTATMRTMGDDVAEALALLGVRPTWAEESGRVTGLELVPETELARPRIDVVLRISGFFRDAFPHVVALLDDATRLAGFDDDPRIFGAKPGAYGSGILPLLESRDWRTDEDLAAVYQSWSGYSYGRAGMGVPAFDSMARRFAGIEVAVKNQDNREHDIFDSDDYLQDHGGMVATIRALTGGQPKAWFGDSADPSRPRVRSLAEEAARVVRTRVLNPKWLDAMQRHGYKGAFEMAATVDYLFGYDATAQVVEDWMYERVTDAYIADPEVRRFFEASNPWALRSIAERLMEADERGMWAASDSARKTLRNALLEAEGWEEDR